MALALSGCALETAALPPGDDLTREPNYRAAVAASIGSIVGDVTKINGAEISAARRTDTFKGPAWLVCVKSSSNQQANISQQANNISPQATITPARYHAAFIQNEKVVDSRFAVTIDQCEGQSYMPFDWKSKPVVQDNDRRSDRSRR